MTAKAINVTEFKSHCLEYLKNIEEKGESMIVTRRGKPVAVVSPAKQTAWKSPAGSWAGRMIIPDDLHTLDTSDLWECANANE